MNLADAEGKRAGDAAFSGADTRLIGPWLIIARAVWLVLVVPSIGLFVATLPAYYQQIQEGCVDNITSCSIAGALPVQVLHSLGFPASAYAAFLTCFFIIIQAIWYAVGFLLFWRRSDDWLALLASFALVMFNGPLTIFSPVLILPLSFQSFLGNVALLVLFLFFPSGRLAPRWMGLMLLLDIIFQFLNNLPSKGVPFDNNWPGWLYLLINLVLFGTIIISQVYRYRRISTPLQRQQTKWVILGAMIAIGMYIVLLVPSLLIPSINNSVLWNEAWGLLLPIALTLIPLSIGFSILRYRLYDIDLLINRTLVYGTLTISLAAVYIGLVIGLQAFVRLFTGQLAQSPVVIVASTLAIAALFRPLRHRIQAIIDHRFYRRKYDAAKTVAAFSTALRSEVDLQQLSEHLIAVVQETMQPTSVSLWLRSPQQLNHSQGQEAGQQTRQGRTQ